MRAIVQRPVGTGQRCFGRFQRENGLLGEHVVHVDGAAFLGDEDLLRIVGMPAHGDAGRTQVEDGATFAIVLVGPDAARVVVADCGQVSAVVVPGDVVDVAGVAWIGVV